MGVGVVINFPSLPCPGDVAIKATGVRSLFPPVHGPDSNPIEQAFSKVEHLDARRSKTIGGIRRAPDYRRDLPGRGMRRTTSETPDMFPRKRDGP